MNKQNVVHPLMEGYSTTKRKEVLTPAATWTDLGNMLSERCQGHILYDSIYLWKMGKSIEAESTFVAARGWEKGLRRDE